MLSHNDIHEAAHRKLEALREEATRHRDCDTDQTLLSRERSGFLKWARRATRRTRREVPAPIPPSPSASRL